MTHAPEAAEPILPRAVPWALLSGSGDLAVCVPAFSACPPSGAEILVLARPPQTRDGHASRLVLAVGDSCGRVRRFLLAGVPAAAERAVAQAASVVVVEEDARAATGRRHAYVAGVRAAVPGGGR